MSIIVQNLGKQFSRYHHNRPRTIMAAFLSGWRHISPKERFWALQDISFTVAPGEMLGVIGKNGAGKSTLLRLIGGIGSPDRGKVKVKGTIGALLDLGAGLHPDLTGRENAFVSAVVAGLTKQEVAKRFETMVEFAELEQFIDNPVRTYSTGMKMRLAFSVAVHTTPDVLLVDEFLSVGDRLFQDKCLDRISELKAQGVAIVLISHNTDQIQRMCDRTLWLNRGLVVAEGATEAIVAQYLGESNLKPKEQIERYGTGTVEILEVRLLDSQNCPVSEINSGEPLTVEISYQYHEPVYGCIVKVAAIDWEGKTCFDNCTVGDGVSIPTVLGKQLVKLHLGRLDLRGGKYYFDVGIFARDWCDTYDYLSHICPLIIRPTANQRHMLNPPRIWEVRDC